MQRLRAFTLIEIALSIFILLLLLLLAVPSLSGVVADRRLKQSLNGFNQLVHQAQERSVTERGPGRERSALPLLEAISRAQLACTPPVAGRDGAEGALGAACD